MAEAEFLFLRPYCIQVLESPSRGSIESLQNAVHAVDPDALQQLQEYVMLPLLELLKTTNRNQEMVIDIVCCLKTVVSRTLLRSWHTFSDASFQIIRLISNPSKDSETPFASVSDELKQSVIGCLQELITRSDVCVLEHVYGEEHLPRLGHIVYLLLNLAEMDTVRETRLLAMGCLRTLGRCDDEVNVRQKSLDCLRTFVPGISVILTKVATESGLAGQAIVTSALRTWSELIFKIFHDDHLQYSVAKNVENPNTEGNGGLLKLPPKSNEWLRVSSEKLHILASKIAALAAHSSWQVRLAVAHWANDWLTQCKRTLARSVPICLDVLITLSSDEYRSVSEFVTKRLTDFSKSLSPNEPSLVETVQESLLQLSVQLPSILRCSDDAKKLSALDQLYGYLNILGPSLDVVLMSAVHLDKLSFSLLQLTELDCTNVRLIAEGSANSSPVNDLAMNPPAKSRKEFLHFRDERIHEKILKICQTLGKHGDLRLLTDHFMDRFHESSVYRKQAVLLLNEIIAGKSAVKCERTTKEVYPTICYLVGEYMEPAVWDLKVWDGDEQGDFSEGDQSWQLAVAERNVRVEMVAMALSSNAVLISLLLEGLGTCAQVLGAEFNPLLMKVLYNVLEKLGSPNPMVAHSAYFALLQIAGSSGYSSISDIILQNADYVLDCLSIKLRYKPLDLKGPTVFRVALQHGDRNMLDLAQDIVRELLNNLDAYHGEALMLYLRVLHTLVNAIGKWFPPKQPVLSSQTSAVEDRRSVYDFILEYHRLKQLSDDVLDSQTELQAEPEGDTVEQEPEARDRLRPVYVRVTVDILKRCAHLLPTKSSVHCLLVLGIVDASVQALQDWEDDLLPLVHKIWAPLVHRFSSENLAVTRLTFKVLCTLSVVCGDFVRQRLLKEIWPKIVLFLEKQLALSENKEDTVYRYTLSYKLLLDLLDNIGKLAKLLKIPDVELDDLASASLGYLSSRQPIAIQTTAVKLFEQLWELNSDLVWLKLKDVYSDRSSLVTSGGHFPPVQIGGHHQSNAHFRKNVTHLLNLLNHEI